MHYMHALCIIRYFYFFVRRQRNQKEQSRFVAVKILIDFYIDIISTITFFIFYLYYMYLYYLILCASI